MIQKVCGRFILLKLIKKKVVKIDFVKVIETATIRITYAYLLKPFWIIELMQGSEIYIKAYSLKNIQQTCIKQTLFARALMNGIFKASALLSCCLMGKLKSKNIDPQDTGGCPLIT